MAVKLLTALILSNLLLASSWAKDACVFPSLSKDPKAKEHCLASKECCEWNSKVGRCQPAGEFCASNVKASEEETVETDEEENI
jgi:hypothetical protein